jgi:hypothetical protein
VTPAAIKPIVSVDDLGKIDIRVGTIVAVHDMVATSRALRRCYL